MVTPPLWIWIGAFGLLVICWLGGMIAGRIARGQSELDKEEMAVRRQEAGLAYKVALRLTVIAAVVGGVVSLAVFHAPFVPGPGFLGFLIFLIWGTPGFAPFFALYVILWYNPPQKKVQDKRPTTSGAPATETKRTERPAVYLETWWMPTWLAVPVIFSAMRHERWERAALERRERIARRADITAQAAEKTDTTTTKVRCLHCQHVQTLPVSQPTFVCEQCNAHLKRRTAPANSS